MRAAHEHHLPHRDYLLWDRDDRAKEESLKDYDAECCVTCGVHPSTWKPAAGGDIRKPKVVPQWEYCHVCFLVETAQAAGPPAGKDAKGYHLTFVTPTYDN